MGPEKLNDMPRDEEDLNRRINELPIQVQATIAAYSSFFLEQDVREKFGNIDIADTQQLTHIPSK